MGFTVKMGKAFRMCEAGMANETAFFYRILGIVRRGSQKQTTFGMRTWRVVTAMQYKHAFWNGAIELFPRILVGKDQAPEGFAVSQFADYTIALACPTSHPGPASVLSCRTVDQRLKVFGSTCQCPQDLGL